MPGVKKFKCGACDEAHDEPDEARDCCAADFFSTYICLGCGEEDVDEEAFCYTCARLSTHTNKNNDVPQFDHALWYNLVSDTHIRPLSTQDFSLISRAIEDDFPDSCDYKQPRIFDLRKSGFLDERLARASAIVIEASRRGYLSLLVVRGGC